MMSDPAVPPFDYHLLDEETRRFVQQKTNETHGLLKRTSEYILSIGHNLKAVKEQLPHGQFLQWIETEFEMSRWTARNFINVADKLTDKWSIFHHLPISVLYELAAPSTSEEILAQIQIERIPPTLEAIKKAKEAEQLAREAEQLAREEKERVQQQLSAAQEEARQKQTSIERLTYEIYLLQEKMTTLSAPSVEIREIEKHVVPPEVTVQLEHMNQQLQILTSQRNALTQHVIQLEEEAKTAALKQNEEEQGRRIRLNWYKVTHEFRASVVKILAQWPSSLDTVAFEADDWTQLSQTKELAQRFLKECDDLTKEKVIDSLDTSPE